MFLRCAEPHCHVCCLKYFFFMAGIIGISPYKVECASSEKLKVSKQLYLLSILTGACFAFLGIYYVGILKGIHGDDRLFVVLTCYVILLFNSAVGIFSCLKKVDLNITVLMGYFQNFDRILHHCKPSLYKSLMRELYLMCFGYILGYLLVLLCTFLMYFLTNATAYFISCFVLLQLYFSFLYLALEAHIHLSILKLIDDSIKDLLNEQIRDSLKFLNTFAYKELCELHDIRIQLYLNSKWWIEYYSPIAVIAVINYFIAAVLFAGLLVDVLPLCLTDITHEFISCFYIGIISFPTVVWMMTYLDHLVSTGNDLEGYLFMYPITKLHPNIRSLIENIILALDCCKPICKASEVIVLSRKFLSGEIHITITYTITLIQYYNAYIKQNA